ncbi:hypothetical protein QFC19_003608 [Naganishia cerealis]|uniref:Uncharacterized protein n=1 Tax=Naganishia cerealis TaxID=610337 RepID=A0ACC2W220_9TREE|nr:hypothetical protein QFC19_003608 [Naganishia cerealis]
MTDLPPTQETTPKGLAELRKALIDSVIHDLDSTQQARDEASDRMREFFFETGPTIVERHIQAFHQAEKDCLVSLQVRTSVEGYQQGVEQNNDRNGLPSHLVQSILAQRYHLYAPHPGIVPSTISPPPTQNPGITDKKPAGSEQLDRPVTPQGIDESLADALSSSITGLPGQPLSRDQRISRTRSAEQSHDIASTVYELSPRYLSALVDRILKAHLPPRDYASATERVMITEIVANTVLGNVLRKCSEPWFLWRIGLSLLTEAEDKEFPTSDALSEKVDESSETFTNGVISATPPNQSPNQTNTFTSALFYLDIISCISLICIRTSCRWLAFASGCLTRRFSGTANPSSTPSSAENQQPSETSKYILEPWLDAMMALTSSESSYGKQELWSLTRIAYTIGSNTADRFAEKMVNKALHVDTATAIVRKLTDILFPGGEPAATIPDPSPEEAEEMRRTLECRLFAKIPRASFCLGSVVTIVC